MSLEDLAAVVDNNCEPFTSVAQCDLYIRAANMYWRRVGEELEHSGERIKTRDLMRSIEHARKMRAVLSLQSQPGEVIVPTDCLR